MHFPTLCEMRRFHVALALQAFFVLPALDFSGGPGRHRRALRPAEAVADGRMVTRESGSVCTCRQIRGQQVLGLFTRVAHDE